MLLRRYLLFIFPLLAFAANTPGPKNNDVTIRPEKDLALFFAVSNYEHWDDLQNPIKDAEAIAGDLNKYYAFDTLILRNPTYDQVIETLNRYSSRAYADDGQLFVFFTGHGYLNPLKEGFFIPRDGLKNDASQRSFLAHNRIAYLVNKIPCKHILLGIDACYSGSFFQPLQTKGDPGVRPGSNQENEKQRLIQNLQKYKSRLVITSGGEEPTNDKSQFARQILAALRSKNEETGVIDFHKLIIYLQSARPTPRHGEFGDNEPGSQFLFININTIANEKAPTGPWPISPDFDGDGIPDSADKCPKEFGTAKMLGCPDYDDDGTPNDEDKCPGLAGEPQWHGCPDSDKDGIPDNEDICPTQKGSLKEKGCPPADRDGDGRPDEFDECPDVPGIPEFHGCPDTDRDGVPDKSDKCVEVAGNLNMEGCPDSDHDLIPDHNDKCPYERGELSSQGCPPPDRMNLVYIKGGSFMMGGELEVDESPKHKVTVDDFYLGKYEVTQAEWRSVMGSDPPKLYNKGCNQCPVEQVSWDDVQQFIKRLNQQTGRNYRLPTEAEWEYAAGNADKRTKYSWGNASPTTSNGGNLADETVRKELPRCPSVISGYNDRYASTAPVGSYKPNELNLYDMTGNVWEWCSDWYSPDYYRNSPSINPKGPVNGTKRAIRGGSWYSDLMDCRVTNRNCGDVDKSTNLIGFRLARTP
jgi:formylglycine-generating enzyme required for sulfatase activity